MDRYNLTITQCVWTHLPFIHEKSDLSGMAWFQERKCASRQLDFVPTFNPAAEPVATRPPATRRTLLRSSTWKKHVLNRARWLLQHHFHLPMILR